MLHVLNIQSYVLVQLLGFLDKNSFTKFLQKQVISQCQCLNIKPSLSLLKANIENKNNLQILELSKDKQNIKLEFHNKKMKRAAPIDQLFHFIFHLLSSPVCLIARGSLYLKYHFLPPQTPLPSCNLLGPIPSIRQKIISGSAKLKVEIFNCTIASILHFQKLKCY